MSAASGASADATSQKVTIKKSVANKIRALNVSQVLALPLRLSAVARPLASIEESVALDILGGLEASASSVEDPTAWVGEAVAVILEELQEEQQDEPPSTRKDGAKQSALPAKRPAPEPEEGDWEEDGVGEAGVEGEEDLVDISGFPNDGEEWREPDMEEHAEAEVQEHGGHEATEEDLADVAGFAEEGDEWQEEEYTENGSPNAEGAEAGSESLAWDGEEMEVAAALLEIENAWEEVNTQNEQDGKPERLLLERLRKDLVSVFRPAKFKLEPFGSYVTNLGLPVLDGSSRSDLDCVVLFHSARADSWEAKEVREKLVAPSINKLGTWLATQVGFTVTNVIQKARVPIVMFDTKELSVDISVQQPWGVLNSWHLRDLCESGWPGRLRALARLVKRWVKSKSIHTAKDGSLSSYGWVILVASYLQDRGGLPALLPETPDEVSGPYITSDQALKQVLDANEGGLNGGLAWRMPELWAADASEHEQAGAAPEELFFDWIRWMQDAVLGFAEECKDVAAGSASAPLKCRHIVSVRPRTQEELRTDVTWSTKLNEHWTPERNQVFLTIEEPLNGENVARCVRGDGFWAIQNEVKRCADFVNTAKQRGKNPPFKALLDLLPLTTRMQPTSGVGLPAKGGKAGGKVAKHQGVKRPLESGTANQVSATQGPPLKRQAIGTSALFQQQGGGSAGKGGTPTSVGANLAVARLAIGRALRGATALARPAAMGMFAQRASLPGGGRVAIPMRGPRFRPPTTHLPQMMPRQPVHPPPSALGIRRPAASMPLAWGKGHVKGQASAYRPPNWQKATMARR